MRPGLFLTIGDRQLNSDYIMVAEGCLPGQTGAVTLHVDQRAAAPFTGTAHLQYTAGVGPERAAVITLNGKLGDAFRMQWNAPAALTQAGATG